MNPLGKHLVGKHRASKFSSYSQLVGITGRRREQICDSPKSNIHSIILSKDTQHVTQQDRTGQGMSGSFHQLDYDAALLLLLIGGDNK